jgi:hypothetical protein
MPENSYTSLMSVADYVGLRGGMASFPLPTRYGVHSMMRDSPGPGMDPSELDKGKGSKPKRSETTTVSIP